MKYLISPLKHQATIYASKENIKDWRWVYFEYQLMGLRGIDIIVLTGGQPVPQRIMEYLADNEGIRGLNITFVTI